MSLIKSEIFLSTAYVVFLKFRIVNLEGKIIDANFFLTFARLHKFLSDAEKK